MKKILFTLLLIPLIMVLTSCNRQSGPAVSTTEVEASHDFRLHMQFVLVEDLEEMVTNSNPIRINTFFL